MTPGVPTTEHWRVGLIHWIKQWTPIGPLVAMRRDPGGQPFSAGVCISVTPWGSDRIRWVRLRHVDGSEKSYAPKDVEAE